jgi:subfamily B ATP-binding cassette protein MsbA
VNSFTRLIPYVWPYRKKLLLSTFFAILVAVLWSLNLSAAFPVVKVLMEQQGLKEYVDQEIATAEVEIASRSATIGRIDDLIAEGDGDSVELLKDRARQQSKLSRATRLSLVMSWLKSNIMPWLPNDKFDMLALVMAVLLFATVLKSVFVFVQELLIGSVVQLTVMGIRKDCFRKTLQLDYQTLSLNGTSDLMSRFTYDMSVLVQGLTLMGGKVVREPLKAFGCLAFAFFVNWRLTLLSMLFFPLVVLAFYRLGKLLKVASKKLMESMSRLYKTLEETFDSAKIVIAFNGAHRHRARFHRENKEFYAKAMKLVRVDSLTSPMTEILGLLAVLIALLPGAYLVLRETTTIWGIALSTNKMDMAQLSLMYVLLAGTIDPARKLSTTYAKLKRYG